MLRPSEKRRGSSAYLVGAVVAILALLRVVPSPAQEVTESSLKAVYVYNFVTFTKWPADTLPGTASSVLCVLGNDAVAEALERTVKGREHLGHRIIVSRVTAASPLRSCHVLYLSSVPAVQATQILATLRDQPVLTISDMEGFGELGGIAQFYFERGRLLFSVRLEPAKRARLEISSRLLTLSKRP